MSEDLPIEDARNVALEFECRNPKPGAGENVFVVRAEFFLKLQEELNQIRRALDGAGMAVGNEHETYPLLQRVENMAEVKNYFLLECDKARAQCEAAKSELGAIIEKLRVERGYSASLKSERDEFHKTLLARENSLKLQGEEWVKAMTQRDAWKEDAERLAAELEFQTRDKQLKLEPLTAHQKKIKGQYK